MIYFKDFDLDSYKPSYTIYHKDKSDEVIYCDDILSLDLETTTYYIYKGKEMAFDFNKEPKWYINNTIPRSIMYIWMIGINDTVVYGRTYEELSHFLALLTGHIKARSIMYIHNLSFDFNFLQNALGTNCSIFARKEHKPMKVFYEAYNLEFRCSLFLTNKSLEKAAKDCKAPVKKMVGDLDYNVIRTPLTKLTEKELDYCEYDILCIYYIIKDKLEKYNHIYKIPLTQTGQVRKALKQVVYREKKYKEDIMFSWPTFEDFYRLTKIFAGGYTHSNYIHTNVLLKNAYSFDISSSYPSVLCTKKFPTTRFVPTYQKSFDFLDFEHKAYIMDLTLTNVKAKTFNSFLSIHKAIELDADGSKIEYITTTMKDKKKYEDKEATVVLDNGRIREARKIRVNLCDQDILILNESYTFNYTINEIYVSDKDYLPTSIIKFILQLFYDKTAYKDVEGMESKYKEAKEYINAIYGMFVTKILADEVIYNKGSWITDVLIDCKKDTDLDTKMKKAEDKLAELKEKSPFTSYATGVWCAAYARKHLWDVILKMDKDVIYCDTDSIKFLNKENFKYFEEDNKNVERAIVEVCIEKDYAFKPSDFKATAPDGTIARLGYFEQEKPYKEFKTLGAKKYAYTYAFDKKDKETGEVYKAGTVFITIAGVNKKTGAKYFRTLKDFEPHTFLDYEYAGKKLIRYIDDQKPFTFKDGYCTEEKYGCTLTPTTYMLDITRDYNELLEQLEDMSFEDSNFNVGEGCVYL